MYENDNSFQIDNMIIANIRKRVSEFKQLPYLFVGSGFTKRYCPDSPNWDELLRNAWNAVHPDRSDYDYLMLKRRIEHQLKNEINSDADQDYIYYVNPLLASYIEKDFNNAFFEDDTFPDRIFTSEDKMDILNNGYTPFKYFIANGLKNITCDDTPLTEEIASLKSNFNKIAGVITTNYDCLLEYIFSDFEILIGQDSLLLSNTSNIFQIFKIHGSCTQPDSIVLTKKDYEHFENRLKYLSAKLLTVFVENPVIFIGYSMSDLNIRNILKEVAECLNADQLQSLAENLIFITRSKDGQNLIQRRDVQFNNKNIGMTEFVLSDFSAVYDALSEIKSSLPVKITRILQNMVCDYVYSTEATNNIIFGDINSPNIDDSQVALYVGKTADVTEFGFKTYTTEEIFEDILRDNHPQMLDNKLLTQTFPLIRRSASSTLLPVYKYMRKLNFPIEELPSELNIIHSIDDESICLNKSEKNYTKNFEQGKFISIANIEELYPGHMYKQLAFIKHFRDQVDVEELRVFLDKYFDDVFYGDGSMNKYKSHFKKLIAIYDFLKYA